MKRILFSLVICGQLFIQSCGEDSTESVILGSWFGTNIVREDCDDSANNGGLNCIYNLDQCFSCIQFELNRDDTYTLTANFDASPSNESGKYEAKNSSIRLNPSDGDAYSLPISNVSESTMVIELPLSNGCTAIITLSKSDC